MMKKKLIAVLVLLSVISAGTYAASSISAVGIYGTLNGSNTGFGGGGIGLSLKFGRAWVMSIEYDLTSRIGFALDYWVVNDNLGGPFAYYVGVGGFAGAAFGGQDLAFDAGLRIPIGLQMVPLKKFELFLEVAPLVHLIPTPSINVAIAAGLRVHL